MTLCPGMSGTICGHKGGLIIVYLLWLASAGTSLIHETSLKTASTGPPHINPSEI